MTDPAPKPSIFEQARALAREGLGFEDISKRLDISLESAWSIPYRRRDKQK